MKPSNPLIELPDAKTAISKAEKIVAMMEKGKAIIRPKRTASTPTDPAMKTEKTGKAALAQGRARTLAPKSAAVRTFKAPLKR